MGKDVSFIMPDEDFLSVSDDELLSVVIDAISEKGIQIYRNTAISEILGDGDAKAVRLNSGKVLASQLVVIHEDLSLRTA